MSKRDFQAEQEAAVLAELRETQGYFTIYWAMQTQYRAAALFRLEERGAIATVRLEFPMMRAMPTQEATAIS